MKKKYYMLRIFNNDGSLKVKFLRDSYHDILRLVDIYYRRGYSYAIEVVKWRIS